MADGEITYHMLTSPDEGVSWAYVGEQLANGREAALRKAFPKPRTVGHRYVAVADTFWEPVEEAVREQTYTRKVQSLGPVGQTSLLDDETQGALSPSEQTLAEEADAPPTPHPDDVELAADDEVMQTAPSKVPEEEEVPV
jgi:hypothetical protein